MGGPSSAGHNCQGNCTLPQRSGAQAHLARLQRPRPLPAHRPLTRLQRPQPLPALAHLARLQRPPMRVPRLQSWQRQQQLLIVHWCSGTSGRRSARVNSQRLSRPTEKGAKNSWRRNQRAKLTSKSGKQNVGQASLLHIVGCRLLASDAPFSRLALTTWTSCVLNHPLPKLPREPYQAAHKLTRSWLLLSVSCARLGMKKQNPC